MGYRERFVEICAQGDWDAALAWLRAIFYDPAGQRPKGTPTDYLNDEDDKKASAAQGFDQLVEGFKPTETLDERVAFVIECLGQDREEYEPRHPFQPFNALVFRMSDYSRCSVVVGSVHKPETGTYKHQFGLAHEVVHDEDSHEDYDFTYDLTQHPDQYRFTYEGEDVAGGLLHHDVKLVVFARWLVRLIGKLVVHPEFAAFPKVLPFRCFIEGSVGNRMMTTERPPLFVELVPAITETTLADNPQREAWLAAAVIDGDTSVEARFQHLLRAIAKPELPDYGELVELLREHAHLRALVVQLAEDALAAMLSPPTQPPEATGGEDIDVEPSEKPEAGDDDAVDLATAARRLVRGVGPVTFARVLRQLGDRPATLSFEERILRAPLPATWPEDRDRVAMAVRHRLARIYALWHGIPEDDRAELAPAWDAALAMLRAAASTEPVVALLLAEQLAAPTINARGEGEDVEDDPAGGEDAGADADAMASLLRGDDDADDNEPWPGRWLAEDLAELPRYIRALCADPPPGYVEAVLDIVERLGPRHTGYGGDFDLWYLRLLALGPRAKAGIPAVLALGQRWCQHDNGSIDTQLAVYFGKALMALGCEDVPDFVHRAYDREKYSMEYYKRWSSEAPKRKLAAFAAAFAADAERFADASAWDTFVHDSEPGIKLLVHALLATGEPHGFAGARAIAQLTKAAARPTPLVTKLTFAVADHLAKADAVESAIQLEHLLAAHPALDAKRAEQLRGARLGAALRALDGGAADAGALVAELRERYPDNALAYLLEARYALATSGAAAAAQCTAAALRALSADDIVYRKAVCQYAGIPLDAWDQLSPGTCYGYMRIALGRFTDKHYKAGTHEPNSGLDRDPFYDAFYDRISAFTPEALAEELAGWREELAFTDDARALSDRELAARIDPARWQISYAIAQRLAASAGPEPWRLGALLAMFEQFGADEGRRLAVSKLIWPVQAWRSAFVSDARVQPHLAWFVHDYPGITAVDLAREVGKLLLAAGHAQAATRLAHELGSNVVVATLLTFLPAFQRCGDFTGAIALLDKLLADTPVKKPEYVLIASNLVAVHMMNGDTASAEGVLDALFARDWSRFDYQPGHADDIMKRVVGHSLDSELAKAFRIYFAMAKFNAACLYAMTARPEPAIAALREAVALNPRNYPASKLLAETDFTALRVREDFQAIVAATGGAS